MKEKTTATFDKRQRAYNAGARFTKERMAREAPLDAAALERVTAADIVIVDGQYDHVERVLDALELAYTSVAPGHVGRLRLRPDQLLVVNCPGTIDPRGLFTIKTFVEDGGDLFTTDWALRHVIEPVFANTVAYNNKPTADDVVRIDIVDDTHPYLKGVMDPGDDPIWWLEASSYPIQVIDRDRIKVLVTSRELETKYGQAPVAVTFPAGKGEVFHMISHYYLQRTELRNARHRTPAAAYAASKGVAWGRDLDDLTTGEVESAGSSARMLSNYIAQKKRRNENR